MFNGMMDPELMRLAQEQMSRMSPAEFARIQQQMMANPDLMKIATESVKNIRPEDLKRAAQQLNHTRPEEMAEIGEKLANATPEEIASMRTHVDAQLTYELNAAQMLKTQGNELHSQGQFKAASEKYLLAKKNLEGIPTSKGRTLLLACSLNLMSCYLKTRQYDECIKEGSEVLAYDPKNVKALYRRGQAYKELGRLGDAVSDLSNAHEISPNDEIITDVLRDAKERLAKERGYHAPGGLVIEEITEEVGAVSSGNHESLSGGYAVMQPQERTDFSQSKSRANGGDLTTNRDSFQDLKDDAEAIRSFKDFISNANPETLAAVSSGKAGEISPDMFKAASNMISKMSPEELQKMVQLGEGPFTTGSNMTPGSMPQNITPDMLKTASDMMGRIPPEELQKMFEMASSLKTRDTGPMSANGVSLGTGSKSSESEESSVISGNNVVGDTSSSRSFFPNSRSGLQSNFQPSSSDLQQMKSQMNDPAMKEMFASMIKNMSPEMMANMSEQFGLKLSQEDAAKFQQAMSSLSPQDLDRMMRWADKVQRGVEGVKKTKNWLLGRPGLILAICMLILAVLLHRLGFIGS
ncbi:outer envelope protein 61-like [Pistacia vera]|uniref:outer envelope protein 61-like n=1 Tax=Pistacia vera TaxID=55513 RepID=UPI001262CE45|nr:outer envelope protein 61-like [Pistacia vera]